MKKKDLPSMPFYWGDWFKALDVQMLPRDIRCTWFEMLGRMWESKDRGELSINGNPLTIEQLAQLLGFGNDLKECKRHLDFLEQFSIFSRKKNGVIYCRKIVKNEEISRKRSKCGYLGASVLHGKSASKSIANTENESEYENEAENKDEKGKDMTPCQKYFYDRYCDLNGGNKYVANFGKDGKLFKSLEKIIDPEEIKKLIDLFLKSTDDFIVKAGHTVGVFYSQVNKLRGKKNSSSFVSDKTKETIEGMKLWMKDGSL